MAVNDDDNNESAFDALPDPDPVAKPVSDAEVSAEPLIEHASDDLPLTDDGWPYSERMPPGDAPPIVKLPDRADDDEPDDEPPRDEMGFFDHLSELRSRIIKAIIGLA